MSEGDPKVDFDAFRAWAGQLGLNLEEAQARDLFRGLVYVETLSRQVRKRYQDYEEFAPVARGPGR